MQQKQASQQDVVVNMIRNPGILTVAAEVLAARTNPAGLVSRCTASSASSKSVVPAS